MVLGGTRLGLGQESGLSGPVPHTHSHQKPLSTPTSQAAPTAGQMEYSTGLPGNILCQPLRPSPRPVGAAQQWPALAQPAKEETSAGALGCLGTSQLCQFTEAWNDIGLGSSGTAHPGQNYPIATCTCQGSGGQASPGGAKGPFGETVGWQVAWADLPQLWGLQLPSSFKARPYLVI